MDLIGAVAYHRKTVAQKVELGIRSEATLHLYTEYGDRLIAFLEESGLPSDLRVLSEQFALDWAGWLKGRARPGRRGGKTVVANSLVYLKILSRFLWRRNLLSVDPLARLEIPKVRPLQVRPFTRAEAEAITAALSSEPDAVRNRALWRVLMDTGCRIGELLACDLGDLDVQQGLLTFRHTKNHQERTVLLRVADVRGGGPCLQALRDWLRVRRPSDPYEPALWLGSEGARLTQRRVGKMFGRWGLKAGVWPCHPHRCRHTAVSHLLGKAPGAEEAVRRRIGHLDRGTLRIYAHPVPGGEAHVAQLASISSEWRL